MGYYDFWFKREKASIKSTFISKILMQQRYLKIIKTIQKLAKKKKIDILEIGPGSGQFIETCLKKKCHIEYSEGSKVNYKKLKASYPKLKAYNQIVPPIKLPKEKKYDLIFLDQVFEHFSNVTEAELALSEIKKKLKKSSFICIIAPDYKVWKTDFFDGDYTHRTLVTKNIMTQYLDNNGFKIILNKYIVFNLIGGVSTFFIGIIAKLLLNPLIGMFHNTLIGKKINKAKYGLLRSVYIIAKNEN